MTNTKLLYEVIGKSGFKLKKIAEYLEISRVGLTNKINNITEFKASEICKLCKLLNLSNDLRERIFFTHFVE